MSKKVSKIKITFGNMSKLFFIVWFFNILFFFCYIIFPLLAKNIPDSVLIADILLGILAFVLGFTFWFLSKAKTNSNFKDLQQKQTEKNNYSPFFSTHSALIILLILLLTSAGYLYGKTQNLEQKQKTERQELVLQPTPTVLQPIPTLKPRAKEYIAPVPQANSEPWGVSKQIDEVTWTMKVGQDERIGTPQEIFEALNAYRQQHGRGILTWDQNLATFAQQRTTYFNSIKNIDKHVGFKEYVNNIENLKKLGFWSVGENCNYGQRLLGVHLIEWIYAGDKPHDDNQLNSLWTHVGIGVEGLGVAIIFGANKI